MHTETDDNALIGATELSRLRWRCRRGLLENDLFVARFFERHAATLSLRHATGLQMLMDLADNDLLDLLLVRREPEDELACPEVIEVLGMLRAKPLPSIDVPLIGPPPADAPVPTCRPRSN